MANHWIIEFMDGTTERAYGDLTVADNGQLVVSERFGVTGGQKSWIAYPLINVKSYRKEGT